MTTTTAPDARRAPQAPDPEEFRALGHDLVDRIAEFLETIPSRPVAPGESPREVRAALGAERPLLAVGLLQGRDADQRLAVTRAPTVLQ